MITLCWNIICTCRGYWADYYFYNTQEFGRRKMLFICWHRPLLTFINNTSNNINKSRKLALGETPTETIDVAGGGFSQSCFFFNQPYIVLLRNLIFISVCCRPQIRMDVFWRAYRKTLLVFRSCKNHLKISFW